PQPPHISQGQRHSAAEQEVMSSITLKQLKLVVDQEWTKVGIGKMGNSNLVHMIVHGAKPAICPCLFPSSGLPEHVYCSTPSQRVNTSENTTVPLPSWGMVV